MNDWFWMNYALLAGFDLWNRNLNHLFLFFNFICFSLYFYHIRLGNNFFTLLRWTFAFNKRYQRIVFDQIWNWVFCFVDERHNFVTIRAFNLEFKLFWRFCDLIQALFTKWMATIQHPKLLKKLWINLQRHTCGGIPII